MFNSRIFQDFILADSKVTRSCDSTSVSSLLTASLLISLAALSACGGGGGASRRCCDSFGQFRDECGAEFRGFGIAHGCGDLQERSARTGQNLTESTLTPANVNAAGFGLLRNLMVDGKVDAQPLYLSHLTLSGGSHNVVYVATENNSVYAFDSDTGAVLWHVSLNDSGEVAGDNHGCTQVTPTIGITSTPVIDRKAGANGRDIPGRDEHGFIGNLSPATARVGRNERCGTIGRPTSISATYGATSFEPGGYTERAALLLSNGTLYTSWSSHCDGSTYGGWIIAYGESTLAPAAVLNVAPGASSAPLDTGSAATGGAANQGPSIWMSGAGPGADTAGNVYLLTANGQFETTLNNTENTASPAG